MVPAGEERDAAIALARQIAGEVALMSSRSARRPSIARSKCRWREAYDYASEVMTENMMARDAEEGICAFIEKREPTWEDRSRAARMSNPSRVFTPAAQKAQAERGSAKAYEARMAEGFPRR